MKRIMKRWLGFLCLYIITTTLTFWRGGIIGLKQCISTKRGLRQFTSTGLISFWNEQHNNVPLIYIITPTVYRSEQIADLTRMSHTLRLVPRIHWIVVEDKRTKSDHIEKLLNGTGLNFTHLAITRLNLRLLVGPHKGDPQRNLGLDWVTNHGELPSVVYLADDDNTYSLRLFEEMRFTKRVSVWPVALAGNCKYETPILKDGKVIDFASGWYNGRVFPLDMAGFAVNSELFKRPNSPRISYEILYGFSETNLLEQLNVSFHELEPKADNCTKLPTTPKKPAYLDLINEYF